MNFKDINQAEFIALFPDTENKDLAVKYNVQESTIRMWAAKLAIKKSTGVWEKGDERFLLLKYGKPEYPLADLANKLNRSEWAVINKYRELKGLRENTKLKTLKLRVNIDRELNQKLISKNVSQLDIDNVCSEALNKLLKGYKK